MSNKQTAKAQILEQLSDGRRKRSDIIKSTGHKETTIKKALAGLVAAGEVEKIGGGWYAIPSSAELPETPQKTEKRAPVESRKSQSDTQSPRGETENIETINRLLDAYDVVLNDIIASLRGELATKATIEEKIDLIKSLRWVAATVDQLMKRWYLVNRGYDNNTRQAVEDAKQKTEHREKQEMGNALPEDQLEVVGDYDVEMRELLESLPEPIKKEVTV